MGKPMLPSRFLTGFGYLLHGTSEIIKNPGLRKFAIIPFLIDVGLFFVVFIWGSLQISEWANVALGYLIGPEAGIWFDLVYYPLIIIFLLAFAVVSVYLIYFLGMIIAAPFNSFLAEKALMEAGVVKPRPFQLKNWIRVTMKMFLVALLKAVIFGFIGIFIFIASFLPGLNIGASFAAFLILAFDSMDYSFEILEWGLAKRINYFKQNFAEFAGMASSIGLTVFIPGLTFLLLPSAVVGAAEVIHKINSHSHGQ